MRPGAPVPWLEGIILLVLIIFAVAPLSWKRCVKCAFIIVILEGAIRKWLVPGLSQFVYFGKDILMVAALFKYLMADNPNARAPISDSLLKFLCLGSAAAIMLAAGNDALGSPIIGIMGARNYLLYLPLVYLSQYLFDTQEELVSALKWYLPLSIPVCVLALIQHLSPASSPLNVYVSTSDTSLALVGANVRATGTFSYIAGYAAYLQTIAALVLPMLVIHHTTRWKFIFRLTLGSVVLGILFSGSRGPVVALILFMAGYLLLNKRFRELGLYRQFFLPILIGLVVLPVYFADTLGSFGERFSGNQDIGQRVFSSFTAPLDNIVYSGVLGFGAGATYQANDKIREVFDLPKGTPIPVYYEAEPERVMLEIGPIGFFLWYLLRFRIIWLLWVTHRSLNNPLLRELALAAFLLHVLSISGQVVFQITFTLYYWLLAGFIFLLPRLSLRQEILDSEALHFEAVMASRRVRDERR